MPTPAAPTARAPSATIAARDHGKPEPAGGWVPVSGSCAAGAAWVGVAVAVGGGGGGGGGRGAGGAAGGGVAGAGGGGVGVGVGVGCPQSLVAVSQGGACTPMSW